MAEQTKRFQGLRRICQAQEGLFSPSYQVHKAHFSIVDYGNFGFAKCEIEIEATDIWFPYARTDFYEPGIPNSPLPRFPLAEFEFFLNDSSMDKMTINRYHVPEKITNFPCYKITFILTAQPHMWETDHLILPFYTFTNPRVIQALGKL